MQAVLDRAVAQSASQYYSGTLIRNPWGTLYLGVELLYGRYKTSDGLSANDTRIHGSVQHNFVR